MSFERIDKFVDETSFIWFIILVMSLGLLKWLIVWGLYEVFMSVVLEPEKPKKSKKTKKTKKKKEDDTPEDLDKKVYI